MRIRTLAPDDLQAVQTISPADIKPVIEFSAFPTLVAEQDGRIAGYCQFTVTPDLTLHSLAIRVHADFKGQGVGQQLADARVEIGRQLGCTFHIAAVAAEGEEAMKKILLNQGLHLCRQRPDVWIYAGGLDG